VAELDFRSNWLYGGKTSLFWKLKSIIFVIVQTFCL